MLEQIHLGGEPLWQRNASSSLPRRSESTGTSSSLLAPPQSVSYTEARFLLKADVGKHAEGEGLIDKAIAQMLGASAATVQMVRERFLRGRTRSRAGTLYARRVYKRSLDGRAEACLIALACSEAPRGRDRWSFRLLADKAVELGISGADIPSADNGAFSL